MKRIICFLCTTLLLTGCASTEGNKPISIEKSENCNPIVGSSDNLIYGGDPSVLVDGDVVYIYTGHDVSTDEEVKKSIYNIPEYFCYSSNDMVNWKAEGVVMTMDKVSWAADDKSAWASQVAKHNGQYYLYFCSWDKSGKQSIGVAVSDVPQGPFEDIGQPLVRGAQTKPATSSFNDIDPTVWIEKDTEGEEHRYLVWGNSVLYVCELNEDMISVKDINGDGDITCGRDAADCDIVARTKGLTNYTEAPWIYRRSDENGNYYGDYYLFFAHQWRECMAYATTDDLLNGTWSETNLIMNPTSTSNTNHMAVCDFKGKSYFIYHNGSLPKGNGFRRSVCVRELSFNEDGSIDLMEETSKGLCGKAFYITTLENKKIGHKEYVNSISDSEYPYVDVKLGVEFGQTDVDYQWVIRPGKADVQNENYVSIESENKPGLYITTKKDGSVVAMQDTIADESMYKKQTFKTVEGLADKSGVSFESVYYEGEYLTVIDGVLGRSDGSDKKAATFYVNAE